MKNKDIWKPSKFVYKKGRLIASRDSNEVNVSSRLIGDIIARFYDENIPKYCTGKLLDLGCGKVPLYHKYNNYINENICVDWGNTLHANPYLDFESDLNEKLALPDNEFDTIILSDVLEHIRRPEILWKEMYRVIKAEGKLIMNIPFYYWLHEQPHDYFRYTKYALKSMAEEEGFKILLLESYGGVPEILTDLFAKVIHKTPIIGYTSAALIQKLTSFFLTTKMGLKISEKTRNHFPFGYFMILTKVSQ
jgi:SAM-dependent methyltransferase